MGVVKKAAGALFGTGEKPGILGTGQRKVQQFRSDPEAFKNAQNQGFIDSLSLEEEQIKQGRDLQSNLAAALEAQMAGTGPSLAQGQLQDATDRNIAQQQAMAASQRGVNPAIAARTAMQNAATTAQKAASDSAQIRAQEQLSAQNQMAGLATALRQQDTSQQQQAADLAERDRAANITKQQIDSGALINAENQRNQSYESAGKRQSEFVKNVAGGIVGLSDEDTKVVDSDKAGESALSKFLAGFSGNPIQSAEKGTPQGFFAGYAGTPVITSGEPTESKEESSGLGDLAGLAKLIGPLMSSGGAASAAPAAAAASDEDNKDKLSPGEEELKKLLETIGTQKYEYKEEFKDNELAGDGEYVTPMAQELEQSELGKDLVIDTPDGKVVDYGKAIGTILSAQAMLHDKMKKLEKKD